MRAKKNNQIMKGEIPESS